MEKPINVLRCDYISKITSLIIILVTRIFFCRLLSGVNYEVKIKHLVWRLHVFMSLYLSIYD
jgi:hypothetical protein